MTPWDKQLEQDLDWRMEELASLKHQAGLQPKNSIGHRALLRALWAMLYAHYEGFCKFALTVCMEQMEVSNTPRQMCKDEVIVLSLESDFRKFRGDTSAKSCHKFFCETMTSLLAGTVSFERASDTNEIKIKGESNLYPNLLIENCDDLCLPHVHVDSNKMRLMLLVKRRNAIAHGRKVVVTNLEEYQEYENAVIEVMHDLAIGIIDALTKNDFLKPVAEFQI